MMIVDGFSSYKTVTFLTTKSVDTTLKVIKAYQTEAEHQTGHKLKQICLDMGREWLNHAWEDYRKTEGLVFEFTTPYVHQQNGTVERGMCTMLDEVRSIMAESGLPLKYWANATKTVIYVQNLIPSSRQPKCIPAKLWFGKRQDVSYLQPFGTTAYAHIPPKLNISKLYPRSVKVSLLGYFRCDRYKLLERSSGTVFRSRDVIFEEEVTHLAKQPNPTTFSDDNNPFNYKSNAELFRTNAGPNENTNTILVHKAIEPL